MYEIGKFIQNQILGMKWLSELFKSLLESLSIDTSTRLGGSIHFFLYDVVKISILLCVLIFLISWIQSYFPPEKSKRTIGKFKGIGANLIAALLGTVTPFCSCSSIPLFIGFVSAGMPLGVTFSFLISSPMVDLGSLILLTSIFGAKVAMLYVFFGLIIAIIGGRLISSLNLESEVEDYIRQIQLSQTESESLNSRQRLQYALEQVRFTFKKVFPYILVGVAIGAGIHNWVPEDWVSTALGTQNPFSVLIAVVVGVPMYADIFGTIPIAEALLYKGASIGTVLAFMMAVTTLSLPSLIMLRQAIKPKLLAYFVFICVVGIVLVGYLFNWLSPWLI